MLNESTRRMGLAIAVVVALGALAGCGKKEQNFQMPPPEVGVKTVDSAAVPLDLTYSARTVGSREVEVRARVGGILLKRRFEEGSRVREGQPMFQIDPEPIRARLASARAEVAVAKARLEEARRQQERVGRRKTDAAAGDQLIIKLERLRIRVVLIQDAGQSISVGLRLRRNMAAGSAGGGHLLQKGGHLGAHRGRPHRKSKIKNQK